MTGWRRLWLLACGGPRRRSFAHVHWFRTADDCSRCRKIERTFARYSAMNDILAVIACNALGCGCEDPRCPTVVAAVLAANEGTERARSRGRS
jgi:hypothetical protein